MTKEQAIAGFSARANFLSITQKTWELMDRLYQNEDYLLEVERRRKIPLTTEKDGKQ